MKKLRNASLFVITLLLLIVFTPTVYAFTNEPASCEGYDSNQCRSTKNGNIFSANSVINQLRSSTSTSKVIVGTNNRYTAKGNPTNYYRDIGIKYVVNGSTVNNGYFSSYYDKYVGSALFCLDAQYEGYNPLYAERFLLDTSYSIKVKAFDVAVMSVLVDNGILGSPSSDIEEYFSRLIAIRGLLYTFGLYNTANLEYIGAFYSNLTAVNTWLTENSSYYDNLNSALSAAGAGSLSPRSTFSAHPNYYFGVNSGDAMTNAKNYYFNALQKATEYVNNLSSLADIDTTSVLPVPSEVEEIETSDGLFVQKDVVHTVIVSNLTPEDKFIIGKGTTGTGVSFANNTQYDGLTAYISSIEIENGPIWTNRSEIEALLDRDLVALGYFKENSVTTVKITVHFEGYETTTNDRIEKLKCGQAPIKYSIGGSSTNSEFGEYGNYVGVIWYSGEKESQRYVGIYESEGNSTPWTSSYETYLIDACDCDDLIEACIASENINSSECDELFEADCGECAELEVECAFGDDDACEEFGAVCEVECPTEVDNFNCCDADNNLIVSPLDNHEVNINGPDDVYACFVSQIDGQVDRNGDKGAADKGSVPGAVDEEGNSYTLEQNKYCVVSCKEDYAMTMPTAKLVNAGRYFTFSAAVEGTKTCYTNTIDRDLYNKDIIDAQVEMVNAYTNYLKWKALDEAPIDYSEEQRSASPCCRECTGEGENRTCSCTCNASDETNVWLEYFVRGAQYTNYYVADSDKNYDNGTIVISNRNDSASYYEDGHVSGSCSSGCCYASCRDGKSGSSSTLAANIDSNLAQAIQRLNAAQEAYKKVIENYNSCSEWETEINYTAEEPFVHYDYEESYLNDLRYDYGYMDASVSGKDTSEWYCNSSVSSNGSESQATLDGISYDKCDSRNTIESQHYTTIYYTYCDTSGCGTNKRGSAQKISDARYKKVTSTVEASYKPSTLFYNVYPSGEIIRADEGEDRDDAVALENKLPVSLSTERGMYKYTINMTDLGEYYDDNGKIGRLIGGKTAVINEDEYGDFVDKDGNVQYACAYLVNMGITDADTIVCDFDTECTGDECFGGCVGPNCDYECDGNDCIADCIGAGCIYDSDAGTSLLERVVSLSNLFPNGTNSYNWNRDGNKKAEVTIDEIEDAGNSIYDEEPILSVTITPHVASKIRDYNDEAEKEYNNGYLNSTLSCYALDGYEEIACYSSFISDLLDGVVSYEGKTLANNLEIVNNRSLIMGNNYRTESDDNFEYFTVWDKGVSEKDMIGPSWK